MQYPKNFVARVKKAYPDFDKLHAALEAGSEMVGRYLDDSAPTGISIEEVLKAKSLEALQNKARELKERKDLYADWGKLYTIEINRQNQGR